MASARWRKRVEARVGRVVPSCERCCAQRGRHMGRQERTKKGSAKSCAIIARWAWCARFSPRNPSQPMQLLPPRDDLPEMPPRDVPVHRVVHNNRPSARQRGRGAAPVNEFIQVEYMISCGTSGSNHDVYIRSCSTTSSRKARNFTGTLYLLLKVCNDQSQSS